MAGLSTVPSWGIFDQAGIPVIATSPAAAAVADSVVAFDFRREYRISDFPVEAGGFSTYDKIRWPFDARLIFTKGGSLQERQAFLAAIDALIASLALYTVVTPEVYYASATITHYDYTRRAESGATLIVVTVWMREVIPAPAPQFSNTREPSGADPVNGGTVQTQPPTSRQQQSIQDAPDLTNPFS